MKIPLDEEVKEILFRIESDSSVTSILVRERPIYSLCRFYLESIIRENVNFTNENLYHQNNTKRKTKKLHTRIIKALINRIVYFYPRMNTAIAKKAYKRQFDSIETVEENDILIVGTSGLHDSNFQSSEFEELVNYFKSIGKKIYFVQPNYNLKLVKNQKFDKYFFVDIYKEYELSAEEHKSIQLFVKRLSLCGDGCQNIDVNSISNIVAVQLSQTEQLDKIIKKVKPRFVFSKSLYSEAWVILASRMNNAKSIEIQHGVFLPDNIYYFPLNEMIREKLLLPDYIGCLGKVWLNILRQQSKFWNESNSFIYGDKNVRTICNVNNSNKNQKLKVLIAFQPTYNKILSIQEDIIALFDEITKRDLENFDFILRFHPMDTNTNIFKKKEGQHFNITISDSKKISINEELKKVDILITATSMCIYEALNLGVKVISFERFRKLTIEKDVVFVKNEFELLKELENPLKTISSCEYLSELNFDFVKKLIA